MVDCKQSGFFSSDLVEDSACASSRRAAREAREAAREEILTPSVTRVVIFVSRAFRSTD